MIGSDAPDDVLVRSCLAGDSSAFRHLIDRHQSRLYSFAYSLVENGEEARDVVQETFIAAYQALPRYVPQGTFHAWLHKIAMNQCLRRLRSRKKTVAWDDVDPLMTDPSPGPEESLFSEESRRAVRDAIRRLPDDYRVVVALRYDTQLSYQEIAETLGVPVTTVETRLFRAKEKLRRLLQPAL